MARVEMKATRTDRAVVYTNQYGETARVHAWDNGGVLTIDVSFAENAAVAVEINTSRLIQTEDN